MAEHLLTLRSSQSSLLLLTREPTFFSSLRQRPQARRSRLQFSLPGTPICCNLSARPSRYKGLKAPGVLSADSRTSAGILTVDSEGKGISVEPDATGGGGFGDLGGGGGGRGGGGGGGEGQGKGEGGSSEDGSEKKPGMSMSQKLTLGYAALVGVGGVMGYMKSGSQKSLAAGGLSAAVLFYVYTQLPSNPVFASSIGLGISAALLGVMGSRFKKSGKIFPAGVVSVVSLVMTAGYLHGIMRSVH